MLPMLLPRLQIRKAHGIVYSKGKSARYTVISVALIYYLPGQEKGNRFLASKIINIF